MKQYRGKEKCRILKEIRAEIARQNDIEWVVSECKHQGDCRGTCPKCEAEVRQLETALARREALGKTVAVVGISAGICLSVTGCTDTFRTTAGEPLPGDTETMTEIQVTAGEPALSEEATATESEFETDLPVEGGMGEPDSESDTEIPLPGEVPDSDLPLAGEPLPDPEDETDPLGNIGEWDPIGS